MSPHEWSLPVTLPRDCSTTCGAVSQSSNLFESRATQTVLCIAEPIHSGITIMNDNACHKVGATILSE